MNVSSAANKGHGKRSPNLDAKLFNKLKDGKGFVSAKVLSVKGWRNDSGITIELKNGTKKFAFLTNFDGYDIGAIVNQLDGATETDDWIGETIKFTTNKAKTGNKVFVNAWNPMSKKNGTAKKKK